ncbi:MAG: SCO family protein [Ignavibacteriales bacterium]|nr:SCO family protein [Ignavibacteriales bacterium]
MKQLTIYERALWGILVVVIIGVIALWSWKSLSEKNNSVTTKSLRMPVNDFSLLDQYGNTVSKKSLEGDIVIANFIFTNCAGSCPIMTTKLLELYQMFKYENNVRFLSLSVDPEQDSVEVLRRFAEGYGVGPNHQYPDSTRWLFLTGAKEEIVRLCREDFKLAFYEEGGTPEEYIVHSSKFVLLNRKTEITNYFDSDDEEKMKELYLTVRSLLKE